MRSNGHFIGGAWQLSGSAAFQSINPANGELIFEAKEAGETEVDAVVKAGQEAFKSWSKTSFDERLAIVERFKAIVEENKETLALAIAHETGKILWEATMEAGGVVGKIAISIQSYKERTGASEQAQQGFVNRLEHRPHGVMAVYGPYNFPAHLPNGHIIPALLAGNVIVFKPSEITPYVGQLMVEYWEQAGIPSGVIQLVQGAKNTGIALSKHQGLNGILFTGSAATGTALHKQCAGKLDMLLALELGGHNPLVVWDASNIDAAVALIIQSAFITTGQRCTCARRLIVKDDASSDALLARLVEVTKGLTIGKWDDEPAPFCGPLVSADVATMAVAAFGDLVKQGGTPILEMTQPNGDAFVTPGIVDITNVADAPDEEIFAPLLKVKRVADFDAAIAEANNTRYGLSAGLLSDNKQLVEQFMQHIHAGIISINRPTTGASSAAPFGGVGISGNHKPSAYYAADYCAYPMASQIGEVLEVPASLPPGVKL